MSHPAPSQPTPETTASSAPLQVALTPGGGLGQVRVDLESFIAMNIWMSSELDKLETRFADFQTPRTPAGRGKFSREDS